MPLDAASHFVLGVANFGSAWGPKWTLDPSVAKGIFFRALAAGITSFDTANAYNNGESETWLGNLLREAGKPQSLLVSTKFGYRVQNLAGANGGSGRNSMSMSVEASLRRLKIDTIDLLYLHIWDAQTPIEDTLGAAAELVRAGKIRAFGLSNIPSWYLSRADALCCSCKLDHIASLQINYNLLMRHVDADFKSALQFCKTKVTAWGPLANGALAGKYTFDHHQKTTKGCGRITEARFTSGKLDLHSEKVAAVLDTVCLIATQNGCSPSQVALAWLLRQDWISNVAIGVTSIEQLDENLGALRVELTDEQLEALNQVSAVSSPYPQCFLDPEFQRLVHG